MHFWDWKTGYNFQRLQGSVQPGSLDSEAGIYDMTFDQSGSRLITCEADKTIKIYKEDDSAVSSLLSIGYIMEMSYFTIITILSHDIYQLNLGDNTNEFQSPENWDPSFCPSN